MAGELIAVVDDDAPFLDLMDLLLRDEGYRTLLRQAGDGAYDLIQAAQPDLVILDLRLERPDGGLAVLAQLRRDPATRTIPIILCTADTWYLREQGDRLREQGYALVPKPFDLDALLVTVAAALGHQPPREAGAGGTRVPDRPPARAGASGVAEHPHERRLVAAVGRRGR